MCIRDRKYPAIWFSPMWNYLNEIVLVDDYTLEFKFTNPLYQEWENNLYNIFIVPEHIWKNRTEEEITSVSYTHLDVYKRQFLYFTGNFIRSQSIKSGY